MPFTFFERTQGRDGRATEESCLGRHERGGAAVLTHGGTRTRSDGRPSLSTCCGYRHRESESDTGLPQGAQSLTEAVTRHGYKATWVPHEWRLGSWGAQKEGCLPWPGGVRTGVTEQGPHTRLWGQGGAAVVDVGRTGIPGTESCGWERGSR